MPPFDGNEQMSRYITASSTSYTPNGIYERRLYENIPINITIPAEQLRSLDVVSTSGEHPIANIICDATNLFNDNQLTVKVREEIDHIYSSIMKYKAVSVEAKLFQELVDEIKYLEAKNAHLEKLLDEQRSEEWAKLMKGE